MRTVHIEYVEWCFERGTKTRTGEIAGIQERAFRPKMFAVGTDHCPVQCFKNYIDHRPLTTNMPDIPSYLGIKHNRTSDSSVYGISTDQWEKTNWGNSYFLQQKSRYNGQKDNKSFGT